MMALATNPVPRSSRSAPRRRSRFLRFSLASLLLLMIPLGFGFVWLGYCLDNRPIHWVNYSAAELDRNLDEGRIVLVNFRATWDPLTVIGLLNWTCCESKFVTWIQRSNANGLIIWNESSNTIQVQKCEPKLWMRSRMCRTLLRNER